MKQRADGRWQKSVTINGKRIVLYSMAKSERAAVKDFDNQMLARNIESANKRIFSEVAEEWKRSHFETVKYYTANGYIAPYNDCIAEFGEYDINNITASDINSFLLRLKAEKRANQTIKLRHIVLNLIYDYAITNGYVKANTARMVKQPKSTVKIREELTEEQRKKVIESDYLLAKFLLYTGCRIGEALAVSYDDIDFVNNEISISKEVIFKGNAPVVEETTKTKSGFRTLPLLDALKKELPKNKKGLLFNENEKPMLKSYFRDQWERYCKSIGEKITPHQFRHSFSTTMYYAGVDVKSAAALMGHSKTELMMNKYTHLRQKELSTAKGKLNQAFESL